MTRPTLCACGRYIRPLGWASHRKNCAAYQLGLRTFVEAMPRPKQAKDDPAADVKGDGNA